MADKHEEPGPVPTQAALTWHYHDGMYLDVYDLAAVARCARVGPTFVL